MSQEEMPQLEVMLLDQFHHGRRVPTGVEQGGLARDLVPDQIAVNGIALLAGGDATDFAPPIQLHWGRLPAAGQGGQLFRSQPEVDGEAGQGGR